VLQLCARVAAAGNRNAATDACVGALLAHAGLQGAVLNVRTNLSDIHDTAFANLAEVTVAEALVAGRQLLLQTLHAAGQAL
jgi:formiminotetrahydrofolate cyclodeaminase